MSMAVKVIFDTVEDFKQIFSLIKNKEIQELVIEGEGDEDALDIVCLDDFIGEIPTVDYEELPRSLQEEIRIEPTIDFEKVLDYGKYRYDLNHCYFKTKRGKSGRLLLTGSEALVIIPMIQKGMSDKQIFNIMMREHNGFYHDKGTMHNTTTVSTIRSFRKRYEAMELNKAITFYCNNSRVNENPLLYVKFPELDDKDCEVEDSWQ